MDHIGVNVWRPLQQHTQVISGGISLSAEPVHLRVQSLQSDGQPSETMTCKRKHRTMSSTYSIIAQFNMLNCILQSLKHYVTLVKLKDTVFFVSWKV